MKIIDNKSIFLNCQFKNKNELFNFIAKKAFEMKFTTSQKALYDGFWAREKEFSTGLEQGFAIPHAKIDEIIEPRLIIAKMNPNSKISDYETFDKSNVEVVLALLIPAKSVEKSHIKILSSISKKLLDEDFKSELKSSSNPNEIVDLIKTVFLEKQPETSIVKEKNVVEEKLNIVGVSSCPAGVAHTYLAEESLLKAGQELGHNIRMETQGTVGAENVLSDDEIDNADFVIIAADVKVDLSRFTGKKVFMTTVKDPIVDGKKIINRAISEATFISETGVKTANKVALESKKVFKKEKKRLFFPHIMTGISWMIPVALCSAVLLMIPSFVGLFTNSIEELSQNWEWTPYKESIIELGLGPIWFFEIMWIMHKVAFAVLHLLMPVFAGFCAYSIADRPGFIPGLIGGFLAIPSRYIRFHMPADQPWQSGYPFFTLDSGFWGALVIGLAVGYFVLFLNRKIKLNKTFNSMKPMLILPGLGILFAFFLMMFVVNPVFGLLNKALADGIEAIARSSGNPDTVNFIVAPLIGMFTAIDLGGPINKAVGTVITAIGPFGDNLLPLSLGMRTVAIVTPSLSIALAGWLDKYLCGRRVFQKSVRSNGVNCMTLGLIGISEGGLPALMANPLLVMMANMVSAALGSILIVAFGVYYGFADSAIWGWPFASFGGPGGSPAVLQYVIIILITASVGALLHIYPRYILMNSGLMTRPDDFYTGKVSWSHTEWAMRFARINGFFQAISIKFFGEFRNESYYKNKLKEEKLFVRQNSKLYDDRRKVFEAKIKNTEAKKALIIKKLEALLKNEKDKKVIGKINKKILFQRQNFDEVISFQRSEINKINEWKVNKYKISKSYTDDLLEKWKQKKQKKLQLKNAKSETSSSKSV